MEMSGCAYRRSSGPLHKETTYLALGQFFPCLVAGGLLTFLIAWTEPDVGWMLPGLWALLFSMGVFASCAPFAARHLRHRLVLPGGGTLCHRRRQRPTRLIPLDDATALRRGPADERCDTFVCGARAER